jgi:hypothetical protein
MAWQGALESGTAQPRDAPAVLAEAVRVCRSEELGAGAGEEIKITQGSPQCLEVWMTIGLRLHNQG